MRRQHAWCRAHGYASVRTHTRNRWPEMIRLNLRHGLRVVGTTVPADGRIRIVMERRLDEE